jgi:hypothetical protein
MLTKEQIEKYNITSDSLNLYNTVNKYYFIEPGEKADYWRWVVSKGTSLDCYVIYMNDFNKQPIMKLNAKIDIVRNIIYAFIKPVQSQFFYWTLLLLIIHKFNFKKPIMKLILYHYVFRTLGDIVDGLCNGFIKHYFSISATGECANDIGNTERSPLKWFISRQINSFFWYIGEIIGDWYPLLRTKAVARDKSSLRYVYITCILFNITKISIPISQFFLSPTSLYTKEGVYDNAHVEGYYNYYWFIQVAIIVASLLYDLSVYMALKKNLFDKSVGEFGFLKKFRTISEYRIVVSALIGCIGLPVSLVTAIAKVALYNNQYKELNFTIEDFRTVVNNVQYMMIFIDQILLIRSKDDSTVETYGGSNNSYNGGNMSSNGYQFSSKSNKIDSKKAMSKFGNSNSSFVNSNQNLLKNYTYSGIGNTNNFGMLSNSNYYLRNDSKDSMLESMIDVKENQNNWNYN